MTQTAVRRLPPHLWLVVTLLLVAAGLRLLNLTWHSLDGDEGASLNLAHQPFSILWTDFSSATLDPHPLLYYLLLKAWIGLAGEADAALRLPSALAGVVAVALTYRLGQIVLTPRLAALAALLVALNPLLVAESQDVRMYALGAVFSLAAAWALQVSLRTPWPRASGCLLALFAAAALASFSHLAGGLLLPGLGLMTALELRRALKPGWLALATIGAVAAVYVPYLAAAYRAPVSAGSPAVPWLDGLAYLRDAGRWLVVHRAPLQATTNWLRSGLLVVLAGAGLAYGRPGRRLAAWLSPALVALVYLALRREYLQPKTLVFIAAPLALLLAAGISRLGRSPAGKVLLAGSLLALHLHGLAFLWRPGYQKEDWRSAAQFIGAQASPADAVLIHLSWYRFAFGHYYAGPIVHPWGSQIRSEAEVENGLRPLSGVAVLWLVQSGTDLTGGDPGRMVESWLSARYPQVTAVYPASIALKGFAVNYRTKSLPPEATPASVSYPNGLRLVGSRIPEVLLPVNNRWLHPPSTWVHVTLYWSVARPLAEDVRVAVTLEDEAGQVWGSDLPRPADLRAFYAPLKWQPGEIVRQDVDVNTNPLLMPGEYKVVLRVYPVGSGIPLTTDTADEPDWFMLAPVRLVSP